MKDSNAIAFKEWAAVCLALESGRTTLILRKGGIHEGRDGFRVAHNEFWLYPTYLHESAGQLKQGVAPLLNAAREHQPPAGKIAVSLYAYVSDVYQVADENRLSAIRESHVWSDRAVADRFSYRTPGLFALCVRIYRLPSPILLVDEPAYAGCRSWVELKTSLPTVGLEPVLTDAEFAKSRAFIGARLAN